MTGSDVPPTSATKTLAGVSLVAALQAGAGALGIVYLSALLGEFLAGGPIAPIVRGAASWTSIGLLLLVWAPLLLWLWWTFPRTFGLKWRELGFRRLTRYELGIVAIGIAVNLVVVLSLGIFQNRVLHVHSHSLWATTVVRSSALGLPLLLFIVMGVVLTPLAEEIAMRGILFGAVLGRFGFWPAAVGSSLIFGVSHGNASAILPIAASGMIFAAAFQRTRSLAVSYAIHGGINAIAFGWILAARFGHH